MKRLQVAGWFGLVMSIVCFAIYILKSAAGRDPSPALIVVGIATGLGAATSFAGARNATKPWRTKDGRVLKELDEQV
jgi:hypothetical protein